MSHQHCFGDKQYTSNRIYITIRLDENLIGLVGYMCAAAAPPPPPPPPPPIYMTPGHRIGRESEPFGWIYVPPPHLTKLINTHHARS